MGWLAEYRQDVQKYRALNGGGAWKQVLTELGLWALLEYRVEAALYRSTLTPVLKKPLLWATIPWRLLVQMATGISLPCTAVIGAPVHIPHSGGIVVHGNARVGAHCCICQGVTIGISGRGERRGVPRIGDRVFLGVNAVVVGKIVVGDDAVIGANSLVNRDVPPHSTAVGVPAVVVSDRGSEELL